MMNSTDYQAFLASYTAPGPGFAPIPFWFLNDMPSHAETLRQLTEFRSHGIDCVVLHPRIGVPREIPYLSDAFMQAIRDAVDCAKALDMRVILYDEGMYPSGSACGLVVRENPRFAAQCVYPRCDSAPLSADETLLKAAQLSGRDARIVQGPSGGTIRGIHFGQDDGESDVPPAGDILSPDAVDCFIRLTHERYRAWLAEDFGRTIIGFFTDEPSPMGRNPRRNAFAWSRGMEEFFPISDLPLLWQEGPAGDDARARHGRAVTRRLRQTFYGRISAWCHQNGLMLMGHPADSDDVTVQRSMDIPGQDLIMRMIAPEKDPLAGRHSVMGKLTADLARAQGKPRSLNEALGVCYRGKNTWDLPFADAKWMLDHLLSRGCSMLILHAFYYSLREARSGERPPDVGMNSPWWQGYRPFAEYLARLCFLNTGELQADIAVLCREGHVPTELVRPLYEQQQDFIYLDEEDFLSSGTSCKTVLYDAACTFSPETQARLARCHALTAWPGHRPASPLRVQRMRMQGISYMTVFHEGSCPAVVDASGYTQVWFPYENQRFLLGDAPVILAPGQTAVFVLAPEEDLPVYGMQKPDRVMPWQGPWRITSAHETLLTDASGLAQYRFSSPDVPWAEASNSFLLPEGVHQARLFLRVERECAYVYVNGDYAGACLLPEGHVDLSPCLRPGENTVTIRIMATPANWYNRAEIPCGLAGEPVLRCPLG